MKIAVTSDTLGNLPDIVGEFDIFIHCGNFSPQFDYESTETQIEKQTEWISEEFNPWLKSIKAKHKLIIFGHQDFGAQWINRDLQYHIDAITLQDESVVIGGKIIYGMNWIMPSEDLLSVDPSITEKSVYVVRQKERFNAACELIPENVDLLITRIPPYGVLDEVANKNVGSQILLDRLRKLKKLQLHVFGLVPDNGGSHLTDRGTMYANAAVKGFMEIDVWKPSSK